MNYRTYKNSHYEEIDIICPRDNKNMLEEVLDIGERTGLLTCYRNGCTYSEALKMKEFINELKISKNDLKRISK